MNFYINFINIINIYRHKSAILIALSIFFYSNISFAEDINISSGLLTAVDKYNYGNYLESSDLFENIYKKVTKEYPKDVETRFKTALYTALSYKNQNEYKKSLTWFDKSLEFVEKKEVDYNPYIIYSYIADCYRSLGSSDKAENYYNMLLKASEENSSLFSDRDKAVIYYGMAESRLQKKDYSTSKKYCEEALKYAETAKVKQVEASCDIIKGDYYNSVKEYGKAIYHFGRAIDTSRALQNVDSLVYALTGIAESFESLKKYDAAREYYEQILFTSIENGRLINIEEIYSKILKYMPNKANLLYQGDKSRELAALDFLDDETALLMYKLSSLYYRAGDFNPEVLYNSSMQAYEAAEDAGNKELKVDFLYGMALGLYKMKEYNESLYRLDAALSMKRYIKEKGLLAKIYITQSDNYYAKGEYQKAYASILKAKGSIIPADKERVEKRIKNIQSKLNIK